MYVGTTKTIQRGDKGSYGQHFMIAPMSNEEVLNQITCFQLNGTANAVVGPQHMLPDMTNFSVSLFLNTIVPWFKSFKFFKIFETLSVPIRSLDIPLVIAVFCLSIQKGCATASFISSNWIDIQT